jgi:RNA polymerase sigma factor (sigma-70 family)
LDASSPRPARLFDPALNARLSHFVRARVPESDAEDIVQATLAEALDSPGAPEGDEDLARWVFGICRHKIVDWFRRARREVPVDLSADEEALPAASLPAGAIDLARWARRELPKGEQNEQTLEWMLREGDGEKLEAIAAEANVPAPAVRQRVSRLRRYFRKRWAAQAAALAALLLVAIAVFFALRKRETIAPRPDPSFEPSPNAPAPIAPPQAPSSLPAMSSEPDAAPAPTSPAPSATTAPSVPLGLRKPEWSAPLGTARGRRPTAPQPRATSTVPRDPPAPTGSLFDSFGGSSMSAPASSSRPAPAAKK